ncbi:MAG TPA: UDP-N-acetylmuramoyl-L-alanine--D-glutamate ligase [Terriglobia bacterium]|nr:UDP-N-acetylmuramoyl-L-alanine--D-glutamate ligase [Terriglobia bacterium]
MQENERRQDESMMDVRGKRVLVIGLARSGRAVVDCLRERGATITVTDVRPPWSFAAETRQLLAQGIGVEFGAHREQTFLSQDLIVASPGVPWDLPELAAARREGVQVVPEVEIAGWFLRGTLVGVTGSNGKTTTTALLGKMLEASGFPTFVGGNIGVPLISAVDHVSPDSMVVAELSSFQLEAIDTFHPRVAVLLNITPNHLDRHPSLEAYVEAKAQIFRNATAQDVAVLNADDPVVMSLAPGIRSQKILFSLTQNLPAGLLVSGDEILYRVNYLERKLLSTRDVKLPGAFNVENVLAAAAAACALGVDFGSIRRAVREFRGVEHRLEFVREVRGVQFYNDSKATSVDATAKALSAFERGVHLILGGKDKGAPYAPLVPLLPGRVREALLIGAAAGRIEQELKSAVAVVQCGDLETAVRQAFAQAQPGDVILLAPACASYDQYKDFEHRGRAFKELVQQLDEELSGKPRRVERFRPSRPAPAEARPPLPGIFDTPADAPVEETAVEPAGWIASPPESTVSAVEPASPVAVPQILGYPELVYVYEVGAEEVAPLDLNLAEDSLEVWPAPDRRPLAAAEPAGGSAETSEAELLMYECAAPGGARTAPERASNDKGKGRKSPAGQASLF